MEHIPPDSVPPIDLMLKTALPIDDIDQIMISPDEGISVIWVNIEDRPDLAQLSARHETVDGYFLATWFYADPGKLRMIIGLRVDMRQPTRYAFHLAFKVERYLDQLSTIARYGRLWVVPGPPPDHLVGMQTMNFATFSRQVIASCGQGIALELEPRLVVELRNQLTHWRELH